MRVNLSRMRHALASLALLALAGRAPAADPAPEAPAAVTVADAHIEEALAEAGENRAELERALALAAEGEDAERIGAMRFLVGNMTGKGYIDVTGTTDVTVELQAETIESGRQRWW